MITAWGDLPEYFGRSAGGKFKLGGGSFTRGVGLALALMLAVLVPQRVWAVVKVTNVFYGWDESQLKFQNSNVTISNNGAYTPLIHQFYFDTTLYSIPATDPCPTVAGSACDPASTTYNITTLEQHIAYLAWPSCRGKSTRWAGPMTLSLDHTDTNGAPGFIQSRNWELTACDRDADGTSSKADAALDNADLAFAPPTTRYTIGTTTDSSNWIKLVSQDAVTACTTGNCTDTIDTTLMVNVDQDCDGTVDAPGNVVDGGAYSSALDTAMGGTGDGTLSFDSNPDDNTGAGLCFYAEGQKPYPSNPSWGGNLQATVAAGGGSKTVNFSVNPTSALVSSFNVVQRGGQARVEWETVAEVNVAGYNIERLDDATGKYQTVNDVLIPALPYAPNGGKYSYVDSGASAGNAYTYLLEEVDTNGKTQEFGPYKVTVASGGSGGAASVGRLNEAAHEPTQGELKRSEKARAAVAKHRKQRAMRVSDDEAVKLGVTKSGLYFVSSSTIASALGIGNKAAQTLIDRSGLQMSNQGNDVAWERAAHGGGLYFYGEALSTEYTDTNVYWLRVGKGTAMDDVNGKKPAAFTGDESYTAHVHVEKDVVPYPSIFYNPDADFWLWDYVTTYPYLNASSKTFTIPSPDAAADGKATLRVAVQGTTDLAPGNDHLMKVYANDVELGEATWDGKNPEVLEVPVDQSLLASGRLDVKIVAGALPGVPYSVFYIDHFDLDYARRYVASDNMLELGANGNSVVTVGGFSTPAIHVLDVSNADKPVVLGNSSLNVQHGSAGFQVSFAPGKSDGQYLAVAGDAILTPAYVVADQVSHWKSSANSADYLIITPHALSDGAQALAAYRRNNGLTVDVAYLEDVYDEFNYGVVDPYAVRDFLKYAYSHWAKRPKYVVLIGKGSLDQKNVLGLDTDLFPVLLTGTPYGLFPSDNRFADVEGNDGRPDFILARIPVVNSDELTAYVNKVKAYESNNDSGWARRAVLLADNPDDAGDFYKDSDEVAAHLPSDFTAVKVYYPAGGSAAATRDELLSAFNNPPGAALFNYVGHGGPSALGAERFFQLADVAGLTNGDNLPIFAAMTCGVGNDAYPGFDALTDTLLLKTDGGAVAAFAPTGMSLDNHAHTLDLSLVDALYGQSAVPTLGEAAVKALDEAADQGMPRYMLDEYEIKGDPALRVWR